MGKFKKIIQNPGLFFRDYLLKRYPFSLNELRCPIDDEAALIRQELALLKPLPNSLCIDVVFTWVNDSDPEWRKRFEKAKKNGAITPTGAYALDSARFANHDELRYSLTSVLRYLPWVNRIFIVTDQQRPTWIETDERIRFVDHREIIDEDYLPTFNSHVIEACLHRIPGLSEHFIYFNDDVFVARPLPKSHFFRGNGIASLFLAQKSLKAMQDKGGATPTLAAAQGGAKLHRKHYGEEIDTPLVHTYVPLHKSMFELAWRQHQKDIRGFLGNTFRGKNDLNLATFLVPWLAYFEGLSVPSTDICYYFNAQSPAAKQHWLQLHRLNGTNAAPHSFCANDFRDEPVANLTSSINEQLMCYFL